MRLCSLPLQLAMLVGLNCLLLVCASQLPAPRLDKTPAVTDDCPYCQLYGKHFRTRMNLYLFQETGAPGYKYFGVSTGTKARPRYLPLGIDENHVGHIYRTARILAVIPTGSEFVVETATHEVSLPSGEDIGLICRLFYRQKQIFPISAEFIQIHKLLPDGREDPRIDPAIAESIKE